MVSSTTHVIEIELGIGEPAFLPLTLGQELQPISVGKKGMWRIESARVLDVHAFVYFDGQSLFLQSAEEGSAAMVDGSPVGKAWTELHAPCKIEIGAARLRFRALVGEGDGQQVTMAMPGAPVRGVPGGGMPAPPPRREPDTRQKSERPFRPGEFAVRPGDDSTRVAPLESTGAQRVQIGGRDPLPSAGRPIEDDDGLPTRSGVPQAAASGRSLPTPLATGPFPVVGVQSLGSLPLPQPQQAPMMGPALPTGPYPQAGYPMPASGQFQAAQMGAQQQPGMPTGSMPPGPGGMPMGPAMGALPPPQDTSLRAKYRELSGPKKILVILAPLCLLSSFYVLLVDEDPPRKRRPVATADAGRDGSLAASTKAGPSTTPVVPLSAACPPGFEPFPGPAASGGVVPCVPLRAIAPSGGDAGSTDGGHGPERDAGSPKEHHAIAPTAGHTASQKTLERQAVDYVATGEYVKALAIYEQLRTQHPNVAAYGEAVRILRQKTTTPATP